MIIRVTSSSGGNSAITRHYSKAPAITIDPNRKYTANIQTSEGTMVLDLAADKAPQTVNSFVFLAKHHFYDGLTFHRGHKDFVIQGGDPNGNGSGGPGYTLPDEPPTDGYKAGSVAMANSGPNTTGSQFFIVLSAGGAKQLGGPPYQYSNLGQVTRGLDVAQKIVSFENASATADPRTQTLTKKVVIKKVTINVSTGVAQPTTAPPSS